MKLSPDISLEMGVRAHNSLSTYVPRASQRTRASGSVTKPQAWTSRVSARKEELDRIDTFITAAVDTISQVPRK